MNLPKAVIARIESLYPDAKLEAVYHAVNVVDHQAVSYDSDFMVTLTGGRTVRFRADGTLANSERAL